MKSAGWAARQSRDSYVRARDTHGYLSRAAFKLTALLHAHPSLLRPGSHALDLGGAPGSWSQVLLSAVGPAGRVTCVDLLPVHLSSPSLTCIRGDLSAPGVAAEVLARVVGGAPRRLSVFSDAAPNTTGIASLDSEAQGRLGWACLGLGLRALGASARSGGTGGGIVLKSRQGVGGTDALLGAVRRRFTRGLVVKPPASRSGSPEEYVVGLGWRGGAGAVTREEADVLEALGLPPLPVEGELR